MMYAPPRADSPANLTDLVQARARQYGSKLAFRYLPETGDEGVELSYEDVDRQARMIAARLQALCGTGERVLLVFPPGASYVAAFFGCIYSGNLAVPVFPPRPYRPSSRLVSIIRDAGAATVLSTSAIHEKAKARFAKIPELIALPWLATDTLPDSSDEAWSDPKQDPSDVAFLQYTSGSTGEPKGVMLTHANLLHNSAGIQQVFNTTPDDHGVCWLPPYHDMGLIGGILQSLYAGASNTLLSPVGIMQRPVQWLETISKYGATISGGPDFAYDLCCRKITHEARDELDLSSWRMAFTGAEPIHEDTMRRFAEMFGPCGFRSEAFFPCYGLAEATLLVSGGDALAEPTTLPCSKTALATGRVVEKEPHDEDARTIVGCGQSLSGQRIRIVDPDGLAECGPDEVGEIWVSGPSVAGGYFNAEEASQATFGARLSDSEEGPFLRTGDLGFLRQGELFITGRLKDLIIIRGQNHYPQDIEHSVQNCHAKLRKNGGAAFSIEVEGREHLAIVQELERHRGNLDAEEIVRAIRHVVWSEHELEPYAIVLLQVGGMPRTSSGKIRRSACRERYLAGTLNVVGHWKQSFSDSLTAAAKSEVGPLDGLKQTPESGPRLEQLQRWLAERMSARLGVPEDEIEVDRPFFEYGLTSMQIVALTEEMERWIGQPISPTFFFHYPTIAALAAHLANIGKSSAEWASDAPVGKEREGDELSKEVGQLSDEAIASLISQELEDLE